MECYPTGNPSVSTSVLLLVVTHLLICLGELRGAKATSLAREGDDAGAADAGECLGEAERAALGRANFRRKRAQGLARSRSDRGPLRRSFTSVTADSLGSRKGAPKWGALYPKARPSALPPGDLCLWRGRRERSCTLSRSP